MPKPDVITETVGKCLTRTIRSDYKDVVVKFRQFAHFSQFSGVNFKTRQIPLQTEVRIETSPAIKPGEVVFGINLDGSLEWLGEIIDSSD
mgnify:CR=1 FL=1